MAFLEPFIAAGEAVADVLGEAGAAGATESASAETGTTLERPGRRINERAHGSKQSPHAKVTKTQDHTQALMKVLKEFERQRVLVGIPASTTDRSDGKLNNATIGMIMEKGSPGANIPARPWLEPGIESGRERIVKTYETAVRHAYKTGDLSQISHSHERAGAEAVDSVKRYMRDSGHFAPLKPGTIAARARQRGTRRRKSETKYLGLIASGMAPGLAQNVAGIRPLINTGQLLGSVTYVIRPNRSRKAMLGTFEVL